MSAAAFERLLSTLVLGESFVFPGGIEVRRTSLFGFHLFGAGIFEVAEAAEHAVKAAELSIAIAEQAAAELATERPSCSGPCDAEEGRPCQACVEEMGRHADELIVEMFGEEEDEEPASDPAPPSVPAEQTSLFYEADPRIDEEALRPIEAEDLPTQVLPPAVARLCPACDGGRRHRRGACPRCSGRCVRLWCENREVIYAPPATEAGKLVAGLALADLLAEGIHARAVQGAHELLVVALRGCTPETRAAVLERWQSVIATLGAVA